MTAVPCRAQVLGDFRPNYFIVGVPLQGPVDKTTSSIKFQFGASVPVWKDISGREGLDLAFGYTQVSVWDFFDDSSPFRDNVFMPALYLSLPMERDRLRVGIEHRSNGRPQRGSQGDTFSRSVNYAFCEYGAFLPSGLILKASVRGGFGWYDDEYTQEVFWRFLGYADLTGGYRSADGRWEAGVTVTPVFGPFSANVEAAVSRSLGGCRLFVQYNSGYGEALYDWVRGSRPVPSLRAGLLLGSLFQ